MQSYLGRLASANRLDSDDLRAYLAGDKRARRAPVNVAALAVLAGLPEESLRRAMPELSSAGYLSAPYPWMLGRPRPRAAAEGLACRRCAAARGAERIYRWQTHENVICHRHQLWTDVAYNGIRAQLDLRPFPEIVAANRRHRRLICRLGRPAVHFAFEHARRVCAAWHEDHGIHLSGLRERLDGLGCEHRALVGDPASDAAFYPHVVALTRLLASPAWSGLVLDEHTSDQVALGDLELNLIDAEIERRRPGARNEVHFREYELLREAVLLDGRPGTRRFASEIRRTVAPGYVWLPLSYYNKCEPLAEWARDRARARDSISGGRFGPPPAEVYTAIPLPTAGRLPESPRHRPPPRFTDHDMLRYMTLGWAQEGVDADVRPQARRRLLPRARPAAVTKAPS